jgi:hypothetical protein
MIINKKFFLSIKNNLKTEPFIIHFNGKKEPYYHFLNKLMEIGFSDIKEENLFVDEKIVSYKKLCEKFINFQ